MPRGRPRSDARLPSLQRTSGDERALSIVGRIYDAAFDDHLWPTVLNQLADQCGAWGADLVIHDPALNYAVAMSPHADPEDLARYAQTWWRENPAIKARERQGYVAEGQTVALESLISAADFRCTAFFNDFWRHVGPGVGWASTRLYSHGATTAEFVLHPLRNRSPFAGMPVGLAPFIPHLVRSARIQRTLRQMDMQRRMNAVLSGRFFVWAVLVDPALRLLFCDGDSQQLFSAGNGLQLRDGVVTAADHNAAKRLQHLVTSCGAVEIRRAMGGRLAVPRGEGRPPLDVEVVPCRCGDGSRGTSGLDGPSPVATLIVDDPERSRAARAAELQRRFGLTPREASLAVEIAKGDGREAAATRLGISLSTVRMHLSSIFEKTGTRRQAELVRRLVGDREQE